MDIYDNKTFQALRQGVKLRELRQNLITSNLSNVETPDYKAKVIDFEDELARAVDLDDHRKMNAEHPSHYGIASGEITNVYGEIYEDPNGEVNLSGNTVDPEAEVMRMNENKVMYDASSQLLAKKIALTKYLLNSEK